MLSLLFLRHAESVGNVQQRMQGREDYGLTDKGHQQAEYLAHRLMGEFASPTHIYSSPLKRADQTAQILLRHQPVQMSLTYDERLVEGHQGIFQGLTWAQACEQYPKLCRQLETSMDWVAIPGAEAPFDIRRRAEEWVRFVIAHHQNGDRVWVVTHEWILYHLISVLLGSDRTWQLPVGHTGLFEFSCDVSRWPDRQASVLNTSSLWQIHRFNDVQHLDVKTSGY